MGGDHDQSPIRTPPNREWPLAAERAFESGARASLLRPADRRTGRVADRRSAADRPRFPRHRGRDGTVTHTVPPAARSDNDLPPLAPCSARRIRSLAPLGARATRSIAARACRSSARRSARASRRQRDNLARSSRARQSGSALRFRTSGTFPSAVSKPLPTGKRRTAASARIFARLSGPR